jgi:hypothetical protein
MGTVKNAGWDKGKDQTRTLLAGQIGSPHRCEGVFLNHGALLWLFAHR